jgi:hypothetical protein
MHRSTLILLAVAVRLNSVVGPVVVDHAGSVDTGDIELVNQVKTLRLTHFLRRAARLAITLPFLPLPLPTALATSAVLFLLGSLIDDGRVRVPARAALSAVRAVAARFWRPSWSRRATRRPSLPVPLFLFRTRRTVTSTGIGAAAAGHGPGRRTPPVLIFDGEVLKELFGGGPIAEGVLLRRRLHGGGHVEVDEVGSPGLLVELSFESRQEGIARHGPAGGAGAV